MRVGDVRFQAEVAIADVIPDFTSPQPLPRANFVMSTDMLTEGGFGSLAVYSDGQIVTAEDAHLVLPAGGSVTLAGMSVNVDGRITTHGGTIRLSTSPGAGLAKR